ncbi:MAG TPA: amidohydrolase [Segetibacter sp.]
MSTLTLTIIQTELYWEQKEKNLQMLEEKINSITEKTELVILPEMFSTGFSMKPELHAETMEGETIAWMKRISAQKKVILTGSIIIKDGEDYFNRLIWMLPNGQFGQYDKRHLFAFADEHNHYSSGSKRLIASVKGWKINLLVCYDLRFPVWARQRQHKAEETSGLEYDVLVYVANWPEKRSHMWRTLLQARAIENQSYCIGVNRVGNDGNGIYHSGDSMVVSPLGEVLYHKANDEDVFTITLKKEDLETIREKMPFWKDADPFVIMQD